MVWNGWSDLIGIYLPLVIASFVQLCFLLLPINLRNWDDDLPNVITYVGIQALVACIMFAAVPSLCGLFFLGTKKVAFLLVVVFVLAWFRALRLIPLEFTHPTKHISEAPLKLDFVEFHTASRLKELSLISSSDPHGAERIAAVRERLSRRRPERLERALKAT